MGLLELEYPGSAVSGVRFHKPNGNYVAEIGYHQVNRVSADGTVMTSRVRTTHYLGDVRSREEAEVRYESIKRDWLGWVGTVLSRLLSYNANLIARKRRTGCLTICVALRVLNCRV